MAEDTSDIYEENPENEVGITPPETKGGSSNQLVEWIQKEKAAAKGHVQRFREDAQQCFRFRDGHQLSDEDRQILQRSQRPDNAFNAAQKFIRFISGVERFAPEALIFGAVDETDEGQQQFGEFTTRCYDWAIEKGEGTYERSIGFEDMCVGGMGWVGYRIDKLIDHKGLIAIDRLPWDEMWWPECRNQNLRGTRWRARETKIDKDEAISTWPEQEMLIRAMCLDGKRGRPEPDRQIRYTVPYLETVPIDKSGIAGQRDEVSILEWEWYDDEQGMYFYDPLEKEDTWLSRKAFKFYNDALRKFRQQPVTDYVDQPERVYRKVFLLNDRQQLGQVMDLPKKRFTLNCMTAHYDEDEKTFYGLFKVLIDPQRYANKFFNQIIEIIGMGAKGGGVFEEGAIEPKHVDEFENTYAKPGKWNMVAPGAISGNKIKDKMPAALPAATMPLMQYCVQMMEDVIGIAPSAYGQGEMQNTPGITLRQKGKSGLLLLAMEFDSLSRFRKEEGRIIFDLLGLLADDRLIRVGKPIEGQEVIRLLRAPFSIEYELVLDDTERDPNIRHQYMEWILGMAPTLIRMNQFLPEMLDYMPWPFKIRQMLKKGMLAQRAQEQQAAEQGIQTHGRGSPVSPQERKGKVDKLQADTMLTMARTQRVAGQVERDKEKMQLQQMKAILEAAVEQTRLQMEKQAHSADQADKALDLFTKARHGGRDPVDIEKARPKPKAKASTSK